MRTSEQPVNEVFPGGRDKSAALNVWPGQITEHPDQELREPAPGLEQRVEAGLAELPVPLVDQGLELPI